MKLPPQSHLFNKLVINFSRHFIGVCGSALMKRFTNRNPYANTDYRSEISYMPNLFLIADIYALIFGKQSMRFD